MFKELIQSSFTQIWVNIQNMNPKERKAFIKWVIKMNDKNCSFVHYAARPFLIKLIKESECLFNGKEALLVRCGSYIYNVSSKPEIYNSIK